MAEITVALGATMCLQDLDEGSATPPPCAAGVPFPADLAKAIEEEFKASFEVLDDPETGASGSPKRPDAGIGDLCSVVAVWSPMTHVRARYSRPDITRNQSAQSSRHCI